MIGNPGTGKTHLAIGLGMKACINGYSVRFYTAATLATELVEASDYKRLTKLERQLASIDLLIIDELSYLSFNIEFVSHCFRRCCIQYVIVPLPKLYSSVKLFFVRPSSR